MVISDYSNLRASGFFDTETWIRERKQYKTRLFRELRLRQLDAEGKDTALFEQAMDTRELLVNLMMSDTQRIAKKHQETDNQLTKTESDKVVNYFTKIEQAYGQATVGQVNITQNNYTPSPEYQSIWLEAQKMFKRDYTELKKEDKPNIIDI